jgi:hypothetical protein
MSARKYLLDEHIPPSLKKALLRRLPEMVVWGIGDAGAPPLQTRDPDILRWCESNHFTLVTSNRASMPFHLQEHLATGHHIPGIFILRRQLTMKEIIEELTLIWEAAKSDEYRDTLTYLPF